MIALGAPLAFAAHPNDLKIVVAVLSITLLFKGMRSLLYYASMAKHMVGGRSVLFRGILYMELTAMTSALIKNPGWIIITYLAVVHMVSGAVNILRGNEARRVGSPQWKMTTLGGVTDVVIAIVIFVSGIVMHRINITIMVYGLCLIYSGVLRIIRAFRRTAIVYIQ